MSTSTEPKRGELVTPDWRSWLESRALRVDVATALVLVVVCIIPFGFDLERPSVVTILLAFLSVSLRSVLPSGALVGIWLMALFEIAINERPNFATIAFVLVLYSAASMGSKRELFTSGVSAIFGGAVATVYLASTGTRFIQVLYGSPPQMVVASLAPLAALGSAWLIGLTMRLFRSREGESELRLRAEGEAERALDLAQVERVRTTMARDVHDIVGHSLAVIIAQADSIEFLDDLGRIRAVTATIGATARASLQEVREVLSGTTTGSAVDEPQDLETIVEQIRAAGVVVDRSVRGESRPMDPAHGVVVRRVLQEMLTNALRHGAPDQPIRLREIWRSGDVVLEVENVTGEVENAGTRLGLDGMRTRVVSVGGFLEAEAVDDVFTARARIPLPDPDPQEAS